MIPRLHASGSGVAGLAAYTLHDRPSLVEDTNDVEYPTSSERVAWTENVGFPAVGPDLMTRTMQGVVADAATLKKRAGVSARGRKLKDPYGHMSLNWHPNENPSRNEMVGAAREALAEIGIGKNHYAMIIAHNDTAHPHVHVIFCRLDRETGKAAKLSHSGTRLSKWATDWERQHGGIRVENRVARQEMRARNQAVIVAAQKEGVKVNPQDLGRQPPMAPPRTRDIHGQSVRKTPTERREFHTLATSHKADKTPTPQRRRERLALSSRQLRRRLDTARATLPPAQEPPLAAAPVRPPRRRPILRSLGVEAPPRAAPPQRPRGHRYRGLRAVDVAPAPAVAVAPPRPSRPRPSLAACPSAEPMPTRPPVRPTPGQVVNNRDVAAALRDMHPDVAGRWHVLEERRKTDRHARAGRYTEKRDGVGTTRDNAERALISDTALGDPIAPKGWPTGADDQSRLRRAIAQALAAIRRYIDDLISRTVGRNCRQAEPTAADHGKPKTIGATPTAVVRGRGRPVGGGSPLATPSGHRPGPGGDPPIH